MTGPLHSSGTTLDQLLPVHAAQRGMFEAHHSEPSNPARNIVMVLDIGGPLDLAEYEAAIRDVLQEFETIRLRTIRLNGEWRQWVAPLDPHVARLLDLRGQADPEAAAERAFVASDAEALDPLNSGPLFRVILARIHEERTLAYFKAHHGVCDGYTATWFHERVAKTYQARRVGLAPSENAPLPIGDLIATSAVAHDVDVSFWRSYLRGAGPALSLSSDRSPPAPTSHQVIRVVEGGFHRLKAVGQRPRWFTASLAVVASQLANRLDTSDLVLGFTTPCRVTEVENRVPAQLMNVVPLRVRLPEKHTLDSAQSAVEAGLHPVRSHLRARPEQLVLHLPIGWRQGRVYGPSVNVLRPYRRLQLPDCTVHEHIRSRGPVDDLMWTFQPQGADLLVDLRANPRRYDREIVAQLHAEVCHLLATLPRAPS